MLKQAIQKVVNGSDLSEQEMEGAMEVIMNGEATPAQIGSFITALRLKGETIEEITAAARVPSRLCWRIRCSGCLGRIRLSAPFASLPSLP